jgi:hydrogenase maturation protein HypF
VESLRDGRTVAIKGLGGYHLACDATNQAAVAGLRRRKRRDERPFAVMVVSMAAANALAHLGDEDRCLLQSVERPIVIVSRRADARLADAVAPDNPTVGLMLPYTPLHHLLLRAAGRPLVMTSGNMSDEPIAYRDDEAITALAAVADLFLVHDRDIDTRCDDSVAQVIGGTPTVFRRSRGYAPRPIRVPFRFSKPTLAVGALLKNTFALGVDDQVCLGPHIGDLENLETYASFAHAIERMETFLGVRPMVVAHDLHPDYLSTRYARERQAAVHVGVQHHHAHIASAMAEHGVTGPAVGVAFDGTGFGPDGTAWGSEFLWVDAGRYERVASCRPLALPGGDIAIRQVWRQALAVLLDAFDDAPPLDRLALFANVETHAVTVVRQMIAAKLQTPLAHGAGRLFDAAGAIGLARTESRHEGHVALTWNLIADPAETGRYPLAWRDETLRIFDWRPLFRALTHDVLAGVPPPTISGRFHNTLAAAIVEAVDAIRRARGAVPVVLSGGCFQNARLTETVVAGLGSAVQVVRHRLVPPGDGGVALGQAAVACAILDAGGPSVPEGLCA